MKKVIITGANGFIGTALCKELTSQGVQVIAVVRNKNESVANIKLLPNLKIVYCELKNFINLDEVISDRDIDVLYHLAWEGSAGVLRCDSDTQINNIKFTCDVVKACIKLQCPRFVFASSIMEYETDAIVANAKCPDITSLYASAKRASGYMAEALAGSLGIECIRALLSNVYGPGEYSPRLINTSLRKILNGEHCAFSAGEQLYDFIYITDAAKAFVAIGKQGKTDRVYYIGNLVQKPLKDFLCEMRDIANPKVSLGLGELPFNGVSLRYNEFCITSLREDTGFIPVVSFPEGIEKTIAWLKEGK